MKKGRIFDKLIYATMSAEKKAFFKWIRAMFTLRMMEHSEKVKAGQILLHGIRREKAVMDQVLLRYAWQKLNYDPDKVMKNVI